MHSMNLIELGKQAFILEGSGLWKTKKTSIFRTNKIQGRESIDQDSSLCGALGFKHGLRHHQ